MSLGASYEEYTQLFAEAETITISAVYNHLGLVVALLGILGFFSTSFALLINLKNKNHISYVLNSLIASISIGLGAVMLSNYVGVYI